MNLSRLAIGSLTLTPTFDEDKTSYAVTTTNTSNVITATPVKSTSTVTIKCDGKTYKSGDSITWKSGKNTIEISVSNGDVTKIYTVVVTK